MLLALESLNSTGIIFTMPNADTSGRAIIRRINDFCCRYPTAKSFMSLGQLRYFSCVKQVDCVVGNSSSGLLEVPSFKKATINIGSRQDGRLKSSSVIDCLPKCDAILNAIYRSYSPDFQSLLLSSHNPYGNGGAVESILKVLEEFSLTNVLQKNFVDLLASLS